jgi:hypothetical protein
MPACPSAEQIARYQRDGRLFPIDCLTPDEVRHYRGCLEAFEREQGDALGRDEYGNFDLEPRRPATLTPPRTPRRPPWRSGPSTPANC